MNRKQLIFLLAVMAILGGAGLVLLNQKKESWAAGEAKMGDKVLPNFPFNDVAAIYIKGETELHVTRTNGLWRVAERDDYPANFHQISDLLIKIRDLKVVQSELIGPSQRGRVDLNEPRSGPDGGTLIEFKDEHGKTLASLLAGKKHARQQNEAAPLGDHGAYDGRYILLPNDPKNVLLISDDLASVTPHPEQWISRDFFKPERIKSIALASTNADSSWKFGRETETSLWSLADAKPGETLNTNYPTPFARMLGYASFADVMPKSAAIAAGLDQPLTLTVETFDHFIYTLKISAKGPDDERFMTVTVTAHILAGQSADETKKLQEKLSKEQALAPWVYVVNSWIEPLLQNRARLTSGQTAGE
jgi:hypothetical protein